MQNLMEEVDTRRSTLETSTSDFGWLNITTSLFLVPSFNFAFFVYEGSVFLLSCLTQEYLLSRNRICVEQNKVKDEEKLYFS